MLANTLFPSSKMMDLLFRSNLDAHSIINFGQGNAGGKAAACTILLLYILFAKGDCPSFSLSLIRIMSTVSILVLVILFIFEKGVLGIISSLSFLVFACLRFLLALTSSMLVALLRDGRVVDQKARRTKRSNPYTRTKERCQLKDPLQL